MLPFPCKSQTQFAPKENSQLIAIFLKRSMTVSYRFVVIFYEKLKNLNKGKAPIVLGTYNTKARPRAWMTDTHLTLFSSENLAAAIWPISTIYYFRFMLLTVIGPETYEGWNGVHPRP